MNEIVAAITAFGGMGLALGVVLAGASKLFAVQQDPNYELVLNALPGANCGACGFAGCQAYAQAVAAGETDVNLCPVGGDGCAAAIAAIMGVEAGRASRFMAMVMCSGGVRVKKKYDYAGIPDCVAALSASGGPIECKYGCLGLGTCAAACGFGAINVVEGVAVVDQERCAGCMMCVKSCPRKLIIMATQDDDVNVCCSSMEKGAILRKVCEIGCLGCRICEKVCKYGAIHIHDNLAVIDHEKCTSCGDCAEKCPRRLIVDANLDRGPRPEAVND